MVVYRVEVEIDYLIVVQQYFIKEKVNLNCASSSSRRTNRFSIY